jgi:hypothetical protein
MQDKVKEVQDYLEKHGIIATETSIVNAAIKIATRWGGNAVFIGEILKVVDK